MKLSFSFFLLIIILNSCTVQGLGNSNDWPNPIPASDSISFDFENDFSEWISLGGSGECATDLEDSDPDDDISLVADPDLNSNQVVKFRVKPDSFVANGVRAELTFDAHQREGETGTYKWRIFIPDDYIDVPLEDTDSEPNWQLMGQWHQQPVWFEGEDWNNFEGKGESPAVGVNYYFIDKSDPDYEAKLGGDEQILETFGFNESWDDQSVFMLTYGTPPVPVAFYPIEKGQWYSVEMTIRWSQGSHGSITAKINDNNFTDGSIVGPNMWNKESQYFKFGLYRNPDIESTHILYYDDFAFIPQ